MAFPDNFKKKGKGKAKGKLAAKAKGKGFPFWLKKKGAKPGEKTGSGKGE